eukprot:7036198-Alexandrium_andersonii.AAC.1
MSCARLASPRRVPGGARSFFPTRRGCRAASNGEARASVAGSSGATPRERGACGARAPSKNSGRAAWPRRALGARARDLSPRSPAPAPRG